jgi:hypothetical protein
MEKVYPKLVENGFHIIPAKSKEISEQSKLAHTLNGVFSIIRFFDFLEKEEQKFSDDFKRKVICAIVIHDVLKGIKDDHTDVMLNDVKEWSERLSLREFYPTLDERDLRAIIAAHMKWSKHKGAILTSDLDLRVLVFVNLADYLSSMKTPEEFLVAQRVLEEINPELRFTYHKISEVRGYITGFIHLAINKVLDDRYDAFPLLFFPNGILYIGKKGNVEKMKHDLRNPAFFQLVLDKFREKVTESISEEVLNNWVNPTARANFLIPTSFLFFPLKKILDATMINRKAYAGRIKERGWAKRSPKDCAKLIQERTNGEITIELTDEDELLAPYIRIVTSILEKVEEIRSIEATFFLAERLGTSLPKQKMRKYARRLRTGAGYDDCRILAKLYLDRIDPTRTESFVNVIEEFNEKCKKLIEPYESEKYLIRLLPEGLKAMWDEVNNYIYESVLIDGKNLVLPKKRTMSSADTQLVCPLCNRVTVGITQYKEFTGISSKIFTNWRPPWKDKTERKICGICYIEFTLRNCFFFVTQLRKDERCYLLLFVFPQYSFTPDLWEVLCEELRDIFVEPSTRFDSYQAASYILSGEKFNPLKYEDFGSVLKVGDFSTVLMPTFYTPGFLFLIWSVPKPPERATETEKWFLATFFALLVQQTLDVKVLVTQSVYPHVLHSGHISGVVRLVSPHHSIRDIFREDITLQQIEKFTKLAAAIWYSHRNIWDKLPDDDRVGHVLKTMSSIIFPGSTLARRYLRVNNKSSLDNRDRLMQKACSMIDNWRW